MATLSVVNYGAVPNGTGDYTKNFQSCFDAAAAANPKADVFVPAGTYRKSNQLFIRGIKVRGVGFATSARSTIHSYIRIPSALRISGSGVEIWGLNLTTIGGRRGGSDTSLNPGGGIYSDGASNFRIVNNNIMGVPFGQPDKLTGGIFCYRTSTGVGSTNGYIAYNTVSDCVADSIHMTARASFITVEHNRVIRSGDDCVAVVSYGTTPGDACHDIISRNNTCLDQRGGRGITCVGGYNITIQDNHIEGGPNGRAGVMISSEERYNINSINNCKVLNNTIKNAGGSQTGHGAIHIDNTQPPNITIKNVLIEGNDIYRAKKTGIQFTGSASTSNVTIRNNRFFSPASGLMIAGDGPVIVDGVQKRAALSGIVKTDNVLLDASAYPGDKWPIGGGVITSTTPTDPGPDPDPNPPPPTSTVPKGTPKKKADVMAGLTDPSASGAISSQHLRDAIETLYSRTFVSVDEFGALGDNTGAALSSRYSTLAAAQADYPKATALTDTIDWAAHQTAIDYLAAQGGGILYTPQGFYRLNRPLLLPNGNPDMSQKQKTIVWQGAGHHNTWLTWPVNNLVGAVMLETQNNDNTEFAFHDIRDMNFFGNGQTSGSTGVWLSQGMSFRRCNCRRWGKGCSINGAPAIVEMVNFDSNQVNKYFRHRNYVYDSGGLWQKCWSGGNASTWACIMVHPTNYAAGTFETCHFGGPCYLVLKENGVGTQANGQPSPYRNLMTRNLYQMQCQFEGGKNAFYLDSNSPARCGVESTIISNQVSIIKDSPGSVPNGRLDAMFDVGYVDGFVLDVPGDPGRWTVIGQGFFKTTGGIRNMRLDMAQELQDKFGGSPLFVNADPINLHGIRLTGANWAGFAFPVGATAVSTGQLLGLTAGRVAPAAAGQKIVGVARGVGKANGAVIAGVDGTLAVNCTGSVTAGSPVRVDTGGRVIQASSRTDSYVVGYAASSGSGSINVLLNIR